MINMPYQERDVVGSVERRRAAALRGGPIATMSTLDPGQSALATQLQKMLAGVKSPEDYLSGLSGFLEGKGPTPFGGPLGSEAIAALKSAMAGKVSEEYFQKTVAGPAGRAFREEIAPAIEERFVGPGTFWGGAKAESVERQGMKLADAIAAAKGGMAQEALGRSTEAALGYGELMSKGMSDWMQAYAAANPAYSDTIQSILTYLQTPTMLAYQDPEYIPGAIRKAMQEARQKPKTYKEWIGGEYVDVGSHPIMQI